MKRTLTVFLLCFMTCCSLSDNANTVDVKFGSGKSGKVYLEQTTVDGERSLIVDYLNKSTVRREEETDRQAQDIFEAVRSEADRRGVETVIIKYRFREPGKQSNEPYAGLLYEAEKIENGTWKLKKVN